MDTLQQEHEWLHKRADDLANTIAVSKLFCDYDTLEAATDELEHVAADIRRTESLMTGTA